MKKIIFFLLFLGVGFNSEAGKIPRFKVKTFQTYTKTNSAGTIYSGHTSGYNSPRKNVAQRDRNHHMNGKEYGPAKLDKSYDNLNDARKREQQLIDKSGGSIRSGGSSGNTINAIRKPADQVKI